MTMLDQLFQGMETGEEAETYQKIIKGVKAVAPTVFLLLDINGDEALSKRELSHVTNFESSLKKKEGGMRQLLRDVFNLLDSNGDDQLSVKELMDGCASEDVLAKVAAKFHELFPLRSTSKELESFVKSTIESIGGGAMTLDEESVLKGMKWLDEDGDGYISRKEVGKYYNSAGKKFIEMSKTVRQMGPMLAMMGGMNFQGDGGGNGKTAFHMMGDL